MSFFLRGVRKHTAFYTLLLSGWSACWDSVIFTLNLSVVSKFTEVELIEALSHLKRKLTDYTHEGN